MSTSAADQARLRDFYDIEKELAARLRDAPKEERRHLYTSLYDELYRRVPYHPQLQIKDSAELSRASVRRQVKFLGPFVRPDMTFLEIGPGDCALSIEMARRVRQVIAVDVSNEITKKVSLPANLDLRLSDGCNIPTLQSSVDVVYSNQLLEHLHPDDALEQIREIFDCLAPGGKFVCVTPNKLSGPHDVSRAFATEPCGFHLKEYSITELAEILRGAGFRQIQVFVGGWNHCFESPLAPLKGLESMLRLIPGRLRMLVGYHVFRHFLGIRMVATK